MRNNQPVTGREKSFSGSANILSTTDTRGKIQYVNRDFIDIAGFEEHELIGQPHNIVRHPDMPPAAFAMLWEALKSGRAWKGIVKNRCKSGDHYWVDALAMPILKEGEAVEFQSVRVSPDRQDVDRADELYSALNSGKSFAKSKDAKLSLWAKLALALLVPSIVTGVLSVLLLDNQLLLILLMLSLTAGSVYYVLRPLVSILRQCREISDDPVARYVYTGRNDEFGNLVLAIKMLRSEAGGVVGRIADDASTLLDNNESLIAAVKKNREAIDHLNHEAVAVATAMNEMSASIQDVAKNTVESSDLAQDAANSAESCVQEVAHSQATISELVEEVQGAVEVIARLEKESISINEVVEVIRDVAEQTNLLALNAAIEAARAGEQGRGFAVVADEVRNLATRTRESTTEITARIEGLQEGTKAAVQVMSMAEKKAGQGLAASESVAVSIRSISEAMQEITDRSTHIAAAVEQQSAVSEEINANIVRVSDHSDSIAQGVLSSEQSCSELSRLSKGLNELVDQFWSRRQQL